MHYSSIIIIINYTITTNVFQIKYLHSCDRMNAFSIYNIMVMKKIMNAKLLLSHSAPPGSDIMSFLDKY